MSKQNIDRDLDAARINAMIQGLDMSMIAEQLDSELASDKDENKDNKKKTVQRQKNVVQKDTGNVPELKFFEKLKDGCTIMVTFGQHDIPYKEQLWGIPTRVVKYELELIKNKKVARDVAMLFYKNGDTDKATRMADNGQVRYYRLVTRENVLHKFREIAYAKVYKHDNNIKYSLALKNKLLKDNAVDNKKVKENMRAVLDSMIDG